jgi:hypothetical protein
VSNDEQRAFPKGQSDYAENHGMTMRQYYAAHSGITLDDANVSLQLRNTMGVEVFAPAVLIPEMIRLRLEYADAMIAAESAQ